MDEDALVVAEIAELVWLDFVFLGFGVVHVTLAGTESPRALHDALLAEEVSSLDGISFVSGTEDHSVTEIQREHF